LANRVICYIVQTMKPARSFASDNNAGMHAEVLAAIAALARSFHAVICGSEAHLYEDECGAPEKFVGSKLVPVPTSKGKLTVAAVRRACHGMGDQHHVQPRVVSITQATEVGTVYQPNEIKALARFAHDRGMFLHMDGARIANAAASLGLTLRQATRDLGVDVLSFGGTKNGAMGAEAVIFFDQKLSPDFLYLRKQGMQLASKMRFISAQLEALLTGGLWLKSARHANRMAKLLEKEVRTIPQVEIAYPVEANGVFAKIPRSAIGKLRKRYFFYDWDREESMVRWMCSFDTTEEDVKRFAQFVAETLGR
jgi:threonine aldolase